MKSVDNNFSQTGINDLKDITGLRSGMAVAIERTDQKRKGLMLWRCRCDCGQEFLTEAGNILSGKVQSCGCLKKEAVGRSIKDIRGQRFGKIVALEPTDKRADGGSVVWKCRCDCGNDTEVSWNRLRKGKVRSCGCLSNPPLKDYIGKRFGRFTVIGYAGKLNPNSTEHYWICRCDCGNEKTVGQNELQNGDTVSCGCYLKERLLDSLRLLDNTSVTILEHNKKPRVNNKSGYPGVFQEKSGKWIAYISFRKKRYWLGRYEDKEDAIRARQRGEEMHDDFLKWYYSQYEHQNLKKRA